VIALRVFFLVLRFGQVFPGAPLERVIVASVHAVRAESDGVPAEVLLAIAEHESDLQPNAVSYVSRGRRVDLLWDGASPLPGRIVCGYLSAMGTPARCRETIQFDGAMTHGAAELQLWMGTCRGDVGCALRGHAGGTACARDVLRCSPNARTFAAMFLGRARRLGWRPDA
jgi:hypothetical protein